MIPAGQVLSAWNPLPYTTTGAAAGLHGRSPLLRLQSDERLIALVRRGNQHAFEALVARYQSRLLAFCRHMLSSKEDAEDVLQEVFAAAFNAILADEREINVRPWLYRIARNRSLNHLRRATAVGVDSMDVHLSEGGLTTADKVHKREEFRLLIADVQDLPETQRTALLLREIDALSYEQIAEAMETTVPSVKSLLVRARVSLAEAAQARLLSCDEVRVELGAVSEGLARTTAPVRRHLRTCDRCATLPQAAALQQPRDGRAVPGRPAVPAQEDDPRPARHDRRRLGRLGGRRAAAPRAAAGGALQAGMSTLATKAVAGLAAAAIVTAGAAEVKHVAQKERSTGGATTLAAVAPQAPPAAAAEQHAGPGAGPLGAAARRRGARRRRRSRARRHGEAPATTPRRAQGRPSSRSRPARTARRRTPSSTTATRARCRPRPPAPPSPAPARSAPAPPRRPRSPRRRRPTSRRRADRQADAGADAEPDGHARAHPGADGHAGADARADVRRSRRRRAPARVLSARQSFP